MTNQNNSRSLDNNYHKIIVFYTSGHLMHLLINRINYKQDHNRAMEQFSYKKIAKQYNKAKSLMNYISMLLQYLVAYST